MLHFFEDGLGGGGGVFGLGDGASDDEVVGTGGEGGGWGGDAFLVGGCASCGADAGDNEGRGGKTAAEGGDFFGAGDEAIDAVGGGCFSEAQDLGCGGMMDADGG